MEKSHAASSAIPQKDETIPGSSVVGLFSSSSALLARRCSARKPHRAQAWRGARARRISVRSRRRGVARPLGGRSTGPGLQSRARTKQGDPAPKPHSCYIHPLYGLDGEVLTDDFPADHLHHRGVFWAWPHVTVDGRHLDLWMQNGIEARFERGACGGPTEKQAILGVENSWYGPAGRS